MNLPWSSSGSIRGLRTSTTSTGSSSLRTALIRSASSSGEAANRRLKTKSFLGSSRVSDIGNLLVGAWPPSVGGGGDNDVNKSSCQGAGLKSKNKQGHPLIGHKLVGVPRFARQTA